jgi:hypothetical protein
LSTSVVAPRLTMEPLEAEVQNLTLNQQLIYLYTKISKRSYIVMMAS